MKLLKFRVKNFRSIEDSGWLEVDQVTALIGVNESGKTNLLLPLWKLNPARDGELQPTSDYPKSKFGDIRERPTDFEFISAEFETLSSSKAIASIAGLSPEVCDRILVTRYYNGEHEIEFPSHQPSVTITSGELRERLSELANEIETRKGEVLKQEAGLPEKLSSGLRTLASSFDGEDKLNLEQIVTAVKEIKDLLPESVAKTSIVIPRVQQIIEFLGQQKAILLEPRPESKEDVVNRVLGLLPKFVYYSNYGNLDSEIYLPHVVQNLAREDLGAKEAAKARTLRVLFQFVKLKPQEILELGQDFKEPSGKEPTQAQIDEITEAKRTRSILLQSAGTKLTESFKNWWKQGNYRFRFEADGNHFRIWVADDRRPQEVELESRSTGLQWFLSFYLVFLVESLGEHKDAILLLDEPGMSFHPLAQRNLSLFFDNLAGSNQILYTSHSPFLIDANRLERARKVYVDDNGSTRVTPDLRYATESEALVGASYAVYSALNLSVAESLLLGCQPVIVEGASDQFYLTAIKMLLLSDAKISPRRELVFPPSGGTKNTRMVASILSSREESVPVVVLDADASGKKMANELKADLYKGDQDKVLSLAEFVGYDLAEIEDLFPGKFLAGELDRIIKDTDERIADVICEGKPFVPQVEAWALSQKLTLSKSWKVDLARRAKQRAIVLGVLNFDPLLVERWVLLFNKIIALDTPPR